MQPKQVQLLERSLSILGAFAFIALVTIVIAAVQAHSEGVTVNTIIKAMAYGNVAHLFYPSAMLCISSLWVVLYLRLGRE